MDKPYLFHPLEVLGTGVAMSVARRTLIKTVWPDKALYAAVLLLIAGFLGILHGLIAATLDIDYKEGRIPRWLMEYPATLTLGLSVATTLLAYFSLRLRRISLSLVGALTALGSLGALMVVSALAVISLWFLLLARLEGEHEEAMTAHLTSDQWPDKSLAASTLMLITGLVTITWWGALLFDVARMDSLGVKPLFPSVLGVAAGFGCLFASWNLYYQRQPLVGFAACALGIFAMGMYVIGPILSFAGLVLVWLAWREREFHERVSA